MTQSESQELPGSGGKEWGIHLEESFLKTIRGMNHQDARIRFEEVFGDSVDFMAFRGKKQEIFEALLERDGIPVKPGLYELLEYLEAQKIPAALGICQQNGIYGEKSGKTGTADIFVTWLLEIWSAMQNRIRRFSGRLQSFWEKSRRIVWFWRTA